MSRMRAKPTFSEINKSPVWLGMSLLELVIAVTLGLVWVSYMGRPFRTAFFTGLAAYLLGKVRAKRLPGTSKALAKFLLRGNVTTAFGRPAPKQFLAIRDPFTTQDLQR